MYFKKSSQRKHYEREIEYMYYVLCTKKPTKPNISFINFFFILHKNAMSSSTYSVSDSVSVNQPFCHYVCQCYSICTCLSLICFSFSSCFCFSFFSLMYFAFSSSDIFALLKRGFLSENSINMQHWLCTINYGLNTYEC